MVRLSTRPLVACAATAFMFALGFAVTGERTAATGERAPQQRLDAELAHDVVLDETERAGARALAEAEAALARNELDTATSALERARAATPIADHVGLAEVKLALARGRADDAVEAAERTLAAHPDSPIAGALLWQLGEAERARGKEAAAQAAWLRALPLVGEPATRRELKLMILASRQRAGEIPADALLDAMLAKAFPEPPLPGELPPGHRTAEQALAAADDLVARGQAAAAVEAYREAIAGGLRGDALRRARLEQGIALFGLRRYHEALHTFELLGRDPEGRYWRARSLARLGRIDESITGFQALAGSSQGEFSVRSAYLLATLLEDRDEEARALALYERVAAEGSASEWSLDALWRIGWSAWRRGDDATARARFAELAKRTPDEIDRLRPLYWEARAAERAGDAAFSTVRFGELARGWPLSYYGWRAAQRLAPHGGVGTTASAPAAIAAHASADEARAPVQDDAPSALPEAALVRAALLIEAELDVAARRELAPIAALAVTRRDRERAGRLLIAAGDFYRAQRLIVDDYAAELARGVRAGDEALFWLSWPPAFRELVESSAGARDGLEPALVWAIMREESGFRPDVMSSAGAMGLLQLMPDTARSQAARSGLASPARDDELFEPATNIDLGSAYLVYLSGRFPKRLSAAIGSYNAGPNAVDRWLEGAAAEHEDDVWVEEIPYSQTRAYVKRVLRSLHVYRSFY